MLEVILIAGWFDVVFWQQEERDDTDDARRNTKDQEEDEPRRGDGVGPCLIWGASLRAGNSKDHAHAKHHGKGNKRHDAEDGFDEGTVLFVCLIGDERVECRVVRTGAKKRHQAVDDYIHDADQQDAFYEVSASEVAHV